MNKRNVNLDRFHTACASVRPTGPSISDRNIIMSIKEHYAMLEAAAEIATPKQEKYEYLYVEDVITLLNIGKSKAYELMAETNNILRAKGKIIIPGRVPKKLFMEQFY